MACHLGQDANHGREYPCLRQYQGTGEEPGAVVPHQRSNPCGTLGLLRGLSGNWKFYGDGGNAKT